MKFPDINGNGSFRSVRSTKRSNQASSHKKASGTSSLSTFVLTVVFLIIAVIGLPAHVLHAGEPGQEPSDSTEKTSSADTTTSRDTSLSPLTDSDMRHVTGRESLEIDTFTVDREVDVREDKDDITGTPKFQDHVSDLQGSWLGESGLRLGDVGFHDVRVHAFELNLPSGSVIESDIPSVNGAVSIELLMPETLGEHTKLGTIAGGGFNSGDNSRIRMELKGNGGGFDDGSFGGVLE